MANIKFRRYLTSAEVEACRNNGTFSVGDVIFDVEAKILYIVSSKTGNVSTLEPYYGKNALLALTQGNDTFTYTKSDGTTGTITINNVANAGSAVKATNDKDGNAIDETYLKLAGGTVTGNLSVGGDLSVSGESTFDSIEAEDLNVTGNATFDNEIVGTTKYASYLGTSSANYDYSAIASILAGKATTDHVHYYAASEGIGGNAIKADSITTGAAVSNSDRHIFFAHNDSDSKLVYSNNFKFNPATNTITLGSSTITPTNYSGKAASAGTADQCSGNAATANKLKTGVNINGTNFDGSEDITTSKWGTSRNISISDNEGLNTSETVSVDGSANATLKLPTTIKASIVGSSTSCSGNAATATTAGKVANAITIGGKTFDGSSAQTITAADLGLSSAMIFIGTTTSNIVDGSTTNPIVINGSEVTATLGNVVLDDDTHLEYVWSGSAWEVLGDENSYALKSVQIVAGDGIDGGGTLAATRTISHANTSDVSNMTTGGRTYVNSIKFDQFGHVTEIGTGTESNQTDISGNAGTANKVNNSLSWEGYSTGSFDGSAAKTITIPSNTNQLTNGAGYITSSGSCNYATSAGTATDSTKLPLTGGTLTGSTDTPLRLKGSASGAYIEFLKNDGTSLGFIGANSTGPSWYKGSSYTIYHTGNISGASVNYATSAGSAGTASALSGYTFKTLSSKSASGWTNNATDDKIIPTMSMLAYWNGAYSGTSSNLTYCAQGTIIGSNNIGSQSVNYATSAGSATDSSKLPLSGGTLTNANYGKQLTIHRSAYTSDAVITYTNLGGELGRIGISYDGRAYVTYDAAATKNYLYHTGNLTSLSQLTDNLGSSPIHTHSQYLTTSAAASTYLPLSGTATSSYHLTANSLTSADNLNAVGSGIYQWSNLNDPSSAYGTNCVMLSLANYRNDKLQIGMSANASMDNFYIRNIVLYGNPTYQVIGAWRTLYHSGNLSIATLMGSSAKGGSTTPVYWNGSSWTNCTAYSSASVNYATSAGNADTVDNYHVASLLRKVTVANNTTNDFNTFESMTLTGRGDPTTGASLVHAPWSGAGPAGGYGVLTYLWSGYGTQIAIGYSSNRIYIRNKYYSSGAVWSDTWNSVALTGEAQPANGGTSTCVSINYNNDSNSTYQMLWGSGNYVYGTGGIYCNPYYDYLYATAYYTTSDIRYKNVHKYLDPSIKDIANLPIFDFTWTDGTNDKLNSGTSAQAVQQILPNLVSDGKKLTLNYAALGTISGIACAREIVKYEDRIKKLEAKIDYLLQQLNSKLWA